MLWTRSWLQKMVQSRILLTSILTGALIFLMPQTFACGDLYCYLINKKGYDQESLKPYRSLEGYRLHWDATGYLNWWNREKPQHETERTQMSDEEWGRQQSHCWTPCHVQTNHQIDWDSATCITYSTDYYQRLTLESWFTNLEQTPLNRSQQLPAPYKRLIDEIKQN